MNGFFGEIFDFDEPPPNDDGVPSFGERLSLYAPKLGIFCSPSAHAGSTVVDEATSLAPASSPATSASPCLQLSEG